VGAKKASGGGYGQGWFGWWLAFKYLNVYVTSFC